MRHCSACIGKCIRTVFSDLCNTQLRLISSSLYLLTRQAPRHPTWLRRGYATEASLARDVPDNGPAPIPPYRSYTLDRPGYRPSHFERYKKRNLEIELRWLKDPVKLADHMARLLREDDFQKAWEIVKLASKHVQCTVSWNHLIDYEMSKARVANAVKLYNDMKKRAQLPDAYTFTILFRGFSWYPQRPQSTSRAISIYQSMFAEKSPVRPSIIHTNAVLKVCALAHDIEALLGIAANLPTRGSGAPNNRTYTNILNAIRSKAFWDFSAAPRRKEDSERHEITTLAIQQGWRLWVEVRQRWMSGDLHLDEKLVCAMGRLLLLGDEAKDHDDVLSLLEQTMGIPRQIARVADPASGGAEEASGLNDDPELPPHSRANVELKALPLSPSEEDDLRETPSDPFAPLPNAPVPNQSAVRPGRNTLSLVLDACISLHYVRAAQNYWGLLTSPAGYHKIVPDSENYHVYLRLLRLQRSSKLAVELVDEMRSGVLTGKSAVHPKTFRIALSTCVRDSRNRNSVLHAGKLVKMMTDTLSHPDAKALSMYLQVTLSQQPRDWRIIMDTIHGTELGVRNLRSLLAYDPKGSQKQNEDDIVQLVRKLIAAYDVVLDLGNEDMDGADKKKCMEQKQTLTAYLTRTHNRHVEEGKKIGIRKIGGEGTGGNATLEKNRSGRNDDYQKAQGGSENDGFEDEGDEAVARIVRPGKGEWKRQWRREGRNEKWEKTNSETEGRQRMDRVRR